MASQQNAINSLLGNSDVVSGVTTEDWDSAAEIWADELNEIHDPVIISGGTTTITYSRFGASLPAYYNGEPENDADVYVQISQASAL